MWCLERNIHIQAQHLPGIQNWRANRESRSMKAKSNWTSDLLPNRQAPWTIASGPICIKANHSVPMLIQLAPRSKCRGRRWLGSYRTGWQWGDLQIPHGASYLGYQTRFRLKRQTECWWPLRGGLNLGMPCYYSQYCSISSVESYNSLLLVITVHSTCICSL